MPDKIYVYEWYVGNFYLLRDFFNDAVEKYDKEKLSWVLIFPFPLPDVWLQRETRLLIRFPGFGNSTDQDYFYEGHQFDSKKSNPFIPKHFYLDTGLVTKDGNIKPHRVLESPEMNDLADKGYSRYCLDVISWNPSADIVSGDNFMTYVEIIGNKLKLDGKGDI